MKTNWQTKKLSDIGKVFNGNSINEKVKKDKYTHIVDGYPFIATKDVGFDTEIDYGNGVKIPFSENTQFKIAPANTPLICAEGGSAGKKIGFTNQDVCFGNKLFALVPNKNVDSRFIFYYYFNSSFQKHFKSGMTGIIGGVSMNKFKDIEITLPSLPEQQRVVSILDEAFETIAKAKANTEQNLQNAKELFESYLQSVFDNKGDGWDEKALGDVCNVIGGGTPSKSNSKFYGGDIYWATVRDMKHEIIEDTEHKITKDAVKNSSTNVIQKGNVIIATRVGLGKVCILANDTAINQDLRGVVPKNKKQLSVEFLFRWFRSISHKIVEEGTGATVQGVKLPFIKSLSIYLPPLETQQAIVQKLDALSTETKKIEIIYQQKLNDLEELKKSILQKAFSGELITREKLTV